jgi:hypothetical protein
MQVIVLRDDDSKVDITESVEAVYELVVNSMDWGSGFFDKDDVWHIRKVQQACGFRFVRADTDECVNCSHTGAEHGKGVCYHDATYTPNYERIYACECTEFKVRWDIAALTTE